MAIDLPYLASYKNVGKLFEKIAEAKIPEAFTHKFLQDTIGLKATGDRPLISLLRSMEFIDSSGKPTRQYSLLKNSAKAQIAIANAIRTAYGPLFNANENANELSGEALRGLISQVGGTDAGMTSRIAGTFNSLVKLGDFKTSGDALAASSTPSPSRSEDKVPSSVSPIGGSGAMTGFHYNVQVHLPSNGTEETYLNIFNAIRKVFK